MAPALPIWARGEIYASCAQARSRFDQTQADVDQGLTRISPNLPGIDQPVAISTKPGPASTDPRRCPWILFAVRRRRDTVRRATKASETRAEALKWKRPANPAGIRLTMFGLKQQVVQPAHTSMTETPEVPKRSAVGVWRGSSGRAAEKGRQNVRNGC